MAKISKSPPKIGRTTATPSVRSTPKAATSHDPTTVTPYVTLKTGQAAKLSPRAQGLLTYRVSFDPDLAEVMIQLIANSAGGCFSTEAVALSKINACLAPFVEKAAPFSAAVLKPAFISPSQNNAGFLAAVLKAEGLVQQSAHIHLLQVDAAALNQWPAQLQSLIQESVVPSEIDTPAAVDSEDEATLNRLASTDS